MEKQVLGATDSVGHDQLSQAQKMDCLAGGVAHDVNNILTTIAIHAELLLGRLKPEDPLRQFAEDIKVAAKEASSLTDQLLILSRREAHPPSLLGAEAKRP